MNILFIINSLQNTSGTERVATELANALSNKQYDYTITIINRDTTHEQSAYPINSNIKVTPILGNIVTFIRTTQKKINSEQYDYIIVHNMGRLSLLCSFLQLPQKTKLISLEHVAFSSRPQWVQLLSKYRYHKYKQVICLTQNDKKSLDKIHDNVKVINNFSPYPIVTTPKPHSKRIIAVGRLTEQKNFAHLLDAWDIASQQLVDWKLEIYGEGELQDELSHHIQKKQIPNISLMGNTSQIETIYQQSEFLVMSSIYEGFGMVLIEALSFGLPIISYDCPHGPKEIIQHGENGFLVENQNINQLAKYIVKLAKSRELLQRMSYSSLKAASKYQPEEIINTWINEVLK